MARALRLLVVPLLLIALAPSLVWGLSIGQQDTFEDGTTQNWVVAVLGASHPGPPMNIADGGPGGAGDNFLLLTSRGGSGPGSRLAAINLGSQWAGDFIAAGISGILMDLNNLGQTDLSLRLLFADPTVGPPANVAYSTTAVLLPGGSGWTSAFFPIAPADLAPLPGFGSVAGALHNATELRLYHSLAPGFPGEPVAAVLGVDNITATPEPTTAVLLGSGLLALYSWKTWRGRKPRA
ncbi:MAG TPA: hypothetical protein VK878_10220 [Candidatus Deferrimicrobiaceae bacterium]|nr:hypothetical protein [Candidatus Deferrimicrobiaceae bacterium]